MLLTFRAGVTNPSLEERYTESIIVRAIVEVPCGRASLTSKDAEVRCLKESEVLPITPGPKGEWVWALQGMGTFRLDASPDSYTIIATPGVVTVKKRQVHLTILPSPVVENTLFSALIEHFNPTIDTSCFFA